MPHLDLGTVIFLLLQFHLIAVPRWGRSLDRYDDGLQKQATGLLTLHGNDEILERV